MIAPVDVQTISNSLSSPVQSMSGAAPQVHVTRPKWVNFAVGGLGGIGATFIVQPFDLVKTRMQLSGEGGAQALYKNSWHAVVTVAKTEGVLRLYNGLSAALLRQATYTTSRLGVYTSLLDSLAPADGSPVPYVQKAGAGMIAGAIGALIGTPADVALVRMTADGRLPIDKRRNYKNAFEALYRIVSKEGPLTLFRGTTPTVVRAMILNTAQLSTYSQAKQILKSNCGLSDGLPVQIVSSFISGFVATVVSIPADLMKTRLQSMDTINGRPQYTGLIDVFVKTIKSEGVLSLWKGFTPYFLRLGQQTVFTFLFVEQLNLLYSRYTGTPLVSNL